MTLAELKLVSRSLVVNKRLKSLAEKYLNRGFTDRPARYAWALDNPIGKPGGRICPRPPGFPRGLPTGFPDFTHIND